MDYVNLGAEVSMIISANIKSLFSGLLFNSARMFAEKAQTIEESERTKEWPQPNYKQNLGFAIAAVIMSAAALEAAINEIYDRAVDKSYSWFPTLKEEQVDLIAQLWSLRQVERSNVIKKHDIFLTAAGQNIIDHGCEPCQSATALFDLRDTIMHFKPEWDVQLKVQKKLKDRLNNKFSLNQLTDNLTGQMQWFPGRCLGAGCAKWACVAAYNYHAAFASILEIESPFG